MTTTINDIQPDALPPQAFDKTAQVVVAEVSDEATPEVSEAERAPEKPLVIVAHASVGSGHRSAANAIAQALKLQQEELITGKVTTITGDVEADELLAQAEIEVVDILDFGRIVFDGNKTASLFTGATRPIYDLTWRYTLTGRILWSGGTIWSRLMYAPFTEYVAKRKPVAIICTHITAANAAVSARMLTGQRFPIVAVPTDYETEGLWPQLSCDLFCVANEFMAETLRPRKIPEDRILITGIPTREDFRREFDREQTRNTYGLPQDKRVVLALAGAYLPRPYVHFRAALDKTLPYLHLFDSSLHFVFVAGEDKEYARHLRTQCSELGLTNVTILNYVEDMAALMASSDLVICKSGGLTVTECLCAKAPMVLLGKAYGQEKANVNMLTGTGAALHVTTARELLDTLRHYAYNPEMGHAMLINGAYLRKPNAARDIAAVSMELAAHPKEATDPIFRKHFLKFYWGRKPAHVR